MINANVVQATEVRVGGWTYRAEMLNVWRSAYVGAARLTKYYRFEGTWQELAFSQIDRAAYRALRRGLAADAKRGPIE